jgi:hypothetical protein
MGRRVCLSSLPPHAAAPPSGPRVSALASAGSRPRDGLDGKNGVVPCPITGKPLFCLVGSKSRWVRHDVPWQRTREMNEGRDTRRNDAQVPAPVLRRYLGAASAFGK